MLLGIVSNGMFTITNGNMNTKNTNSATIIIKGRNSRLKTLIT